MKIIISYLLFLFYRFFLYYLPPSSTPFVGSFFKILRFIPVKFMFKKCGKNVNIESRAYFGRGENLVIGNNSGIGLRAIVPSDLVCGDNVMMGPDCLIYSANHKFDSLDVPMNLQGHQPRQQTVIGNDVWIGGRVIILPGLNIGNGVIIGAGSVVTRDCLDFGVYAGNPARLIRFRYE